MISIVVPALNEQELLPGCLKSLRDQDYQGEVEIIVADNGSTDNTAAIAREYGATVVPCPEKKSVFYARQVGADAAHGDIIVQADADTVYPRGWLKRIVKGFSSNPGAVAVGGRFIYRDPPFWAPLEYFLRQLANLLSVLALGRPLVISAATFAFKRAAFLAANGYKDIAFAPDQYGIAGRLSKRGKIVYDRKLYVLTSARRVQKPFVVLLGEFLAGLGRWVAYLFRRGLGRVQGFYGKTPSRRIAIRIMLFAVPIFLAIMWGYFIPTSPVFGKVYYKGPPTEKVIAITFDDGPNEPYTSELLGILASHDAKATFFVIGKNVELYPDVARRIVASGNVLANHSYSHQANHAVTEFGARDLEKAQEVIASITGVDPHLYRPPHGKKSPWELASLKQYGLIEVNWDVSANELHKEVVFGKPTPEAIANAIVGKARPGAIILLHDGYGTQHGDARSDKSLTVKALPIILDRLQEQGYRFVTVPQLLNVPAYNNPGQ